MPQDRLKLLIIEDENAIALLIKNLIDFDNLGLICCGIAHDGIAGLEMMHKYKPDIIITDISMPGLSGIDMITQAHKEGLSGHFIISSGLTQFKYAMNAINMGVDGYLLKPINREELNTLLENTIVKISNSQKIRYQLKKAKVSSDKVSLERRRSYLMNLLYTQSTTSCQSREELNSLYGYHFEADSLISIGCVNIDGILTLNYSQQQLLLEQLIRKFNSTIKDSFIDMENYPRGNGFIFILNYHEDSRKLINGILSTMFNVLSYDLQMYNTLNLYISLGIPVSSITEVTLSLESALTALNARVLMPNNHVLMAENLLTTREPNFYTISETDLSVLLSNIELMNQDAVRNNLITIFTIAGQNASETPAFVYQIFESTFSELSSLLYHKNLISGKLSGLYLDYREQITLYTSLPKLINFSADYLLKLLPINDTPEQQENRLAQTAKKYIQEHLKEDLRLEDVANQFFLSPSYFGVLFKEKIGEPFSSFLTTTRMNHAKALLAESHLTVDEICYECGYSDRRYFSKLFKKTVGVSPKDYRKIYQ